MSWVTSSKGPSFPEATVDRIGPEIHPLSGQAKDLGSAAQLVSTTAFVLLWLFACWRWFSA